MIVYIIRSKEGIILRAYTSRQSASEFLLGIVDAGRFFIDEVTVEESPDKSPMIDELKK